MSNTQAIRHEHVKTITNTVNIISMLSKAGMDNDKATEIAQAIDVELNAVLDEKLHAEKVIKIVEEHLNDVATKEFVRAEMQTVKAEIQAEIQKGQIEMHKGLRQNLIATIAFIAGFGSIACGALYFAINHAH